VVHLFNGRGFGRTGNGRGVVGEAMAGGRLEGGKKTGMGWWGGTKDSEFAEVQLLKKGRRFCEHRKKVGKGLAGMGGGGERQKLA